MLCFLIWFISYGLFFFCFFCLPVYRTVVSSVSTRGQSCITGYKCVERTYIFLLYFCTTSTGTRILNYVLCHNTCLGKPRLLSVLNHSLLLKDLLLLEKPDLKASTDELEYINRLPFKSPLFLFFQCHLSFFSCSINNSSAYQNTFLTGNAGLS